jgi:hypothetical protein
VFSNVGNDIEISIRQADRITAPIEHPNELHPPSAVETRQPSRLKDFPPSRLACTLSPEAPEPQLLGDPLVEETNRTVVNTFRLPLVNVFEKSAQRS